MFSATTNNFTAAVSGRTVRYHGTAVDGSGKPLRGGAHGFRFATYSTPVGGAALWQEYQNIDVAQDGSFDAVLGQNTTGLPSTAFSAGEPCYFGIQVDNLPEMPRMLLTAVPFSLKATDAEALGGKGASQYATVDQLQAANKNLARTDLSNLFAGDQQIRGNISANGVATPALAATVGSFGALTASGDVAVQGVVNARSFQGDGAALANINATTVGGIPASDLPRKNIANRFAASQTFGGGAVMDAAALASATNSDGASSSALDFTASVFNSGTASPESKIFRWIAEPVSSNTAFPAAALRLWYGNSPGSMSPNGFAINADGSIKFTSLEGPVTATNALGLGGLALDQNLAGAKPGDVLVISPDGKKIKVQSKFDVDVRDCGLLGDGVTDDSGALMGCLAKYGGRTLHFSHTQSGAGCSYKFNSTITVSIAGTKLSGDGMGGGFGTRLCWPGGVAGIVLAPSCTTCGIDHLVLDGNEPFDPLREETYINPYDYGGKNRADGIRMLGGYQRVENNQVTNWGQHGISCDVTTFGGNCDSLFVSNNWVYGVRGDCFRVSGVDAQAGTIMNNTFQNCQWNGIYEHSFLGNTYMENQVTNVHTDDYQIYSPQFPSINISTISRHGGTVTVQTASAHGRAVNDIIFINQTTFQSFWGYWKVASVPDATHLTFLQSGYSDVGDAGSPAGSIRYTSTVEQNWYNASGPGCQTAANGKWSSGNCAAFSRYSPVGAANNTWIHEYNELGSPPWCMSYNNQINGQAPAVGIDASPNCGVPAESTASRGFTNLGAGGSQTYSSSTFGRNKTVFRMGAFGENGAEGTPFYTCHEDSNSNCTTTNTIAFHWYQPFNGWFGPRFNGDTAESPAYYYWMISDATAADGAGKMLFPRGFYAGAPGSVVQIMDGSGNMSIASLKLNGGAALTGQSGTGTSLVTNTSPTLNGATINGKLTLGTPLAIAQGGTGATMATGAGPVVLATSPTLVAPVLGSATATSINFAGGGSLSAQLSANDAPGAITVKAASCTDRSVNIAGLSANPKSISVYATYALEPNLSISIAQVTPGTGHYRVCNATNVDITLASASAFTISVYQ